MNWPTALPSQVLFTFRSSGAWGVARAIIRKLVFPLVSYQRLIVLEAPLPIGSIAGGERIVCDLLDRDQVSAVDDPDWPEAAHAVRRYRESSTSENRKLAVARDQQRIVGVCLYELDVIGLPGFSIRAPFPCHFVHFIAVRAELRGQGIMGHLLDFVDRAAMAEGTERRLCLVASHNRASLKGFRKSGATPTGSVRIITALGTPLYILPKWLRAGH